MVWSRLLPVLLAISGSTIIHGEPVHIRDSSELHILDRAVNCQVVVGALAMIKILGKPATTFCSSYLSVPSTTTVAVTITPTSTVSLTATQTVITNAGFCLTSPPPVARRGTPAPGPFVDGRALAVPTALATFAAAELSSACRCLSLTPKTTMTVTSSMAPQLITMTVATTTSTRCCGTKGAYCTHASECCGIGCWITSAGQPAYFCA